MLPVHMHCRKFSMDMQYRYSADVDALRVYFTKASPATISNTEPIHPGLLVDYNSNDQVVAVEVSSASKRLPCHFLATEAVIEGRSPLAIAPEYNPEVDELAVSFTAFTCLPERRDSTLDERIVVGASGGHVWQALYFKEASESVCRPIS